MSLSRIVLRPVPGLCPLLPEKRQRQYVHKLCDSRMIPEDSLKTGICITPYVSQLSDRLFLGNVAAAVDEKLLMSHGITHLVTVLETPISDQLRPKRQTILFIPAVDVPEARLHQYFHVASDWIDSVLRSDSNARIMVHCFLGVSRSATLVLAYWIKYGPIFADMDQALDTLVAMRPIVNPNIGFRESLSIWWTLHKIIPYIVHDFPHILFPVLGCIISYLIGSADYFYVIQ